MNFNKPRKFNPSYGRFNAIVAEAKLTKTKVGNRPMLTIKFEKMKKITKQEDGSYKIENHRPELVWKNLVLNPEKGSKQEEILEEELSNLVYDLELTEIIAGMSDKEVIKLITEKLDGQSFEINHTSKNGYDNVYINKLVANEEILWD